MNLNMIRPKNETGDLLLSITKNCQTLIGQTHRKAKETFRIQIYQNKRNISFQPTHID